MDLGYFAKGFAIGFSIAAPVGPIGILCIRRSLADGFAKGLAAGLGAATADAAYGSVAGFGLTAVSGFLVHQRVALEAVGGAFLCYLGLRTAFRAPALDGSASLSRTGAVYASTLFLTLANPATLLSFAAIFSAFGLGIASDYAGATRLVLGVFSGSAFWWLILSGSVSLLRAHFTAPWMRGVNRLSGAILLAFGVYALIRALRPTG
ncbi:MAG TPA: LysE family transporter [Opitutaceae bacterium]|jgi:threonine/homoserine/homoserine lactone efflux protein